MFMTFHAMIQERNQELWGIPASQIHCDNNCIESGSTTKTERGKRISGVTVYSVFPTHFSSVTQNLLHKTILETSTLKE